MAYPSMRLGPCKENTANVLEDNLLLDDLIAYYDGSEP
jgi:hypothetical protein